MFLILELSYYWFGSLDQIFDKCDLNLKSHYLSAVGATIKPDTALLYTLIHLRGGFRTGILETSILRYELKG